MENTTNINDLPIDSNPPSHTQLPEENIQMQAHRMDEQVSIYPERPQRKQVRFEEDAPVVKDTHKVILLAMLFFLLFSDLKVKAYILNILAVIFGDHFRDPVGGISKVGLLVYSMVFGLALFTIVSVVDLSAVQLPF
jgi:hypothetical protein